MSSDVAEVGRLLAGVEAAAHALADPERVAVIADPATRAWQEAIRDAYRRAGGRALGFHGPVGVEITATYEARGEGRVGVPLLKPDVDNVVKPVLDALGPGAGTFRGAGVYGDDAQVTRLLVVKAWGPQARTDVRIAL